VIAVDDDVAALMLAEMLTGFECTSVAAGDPDGALAIVRRARPDVVVIDVELHRPTTLAMASQLIAEDIPTVLISAIDDAEALVGLDGACGMLTRPVSRTALRSTVALVRRQRETRARAVSASRESEARERMALEASRAKTDFLAHMSHELRTPLSAVLGLSEALLEHVFGALNDAQTGTLTTIHASGRHLLALINDVLDIARVESGKLPIESEQVVLRPLIDESTALIHGQLWSKGQRLVIHLAPALPPVEIDRRRIKQVLLNLLGNASKFSPPGATVTVRAASHGDTRQVEIAVSDNGPGIPAADQARIFEPFVTLDPSISRAHGGAGLGLALARRIVDLHGGQLRVDSEVGRGATFTIALPVSSSYAGAAPQVHRAPPRSVAAPDGEDRR
jgi:signal transduction histidine kinase